MTATPPPHPVPQPLERVELIRLSMPLVRPFRTSFGEQRSRDVLLVRVETPVAEGWGECTAPTAPIYSAEYTAGAAAVMTEHLVPLLAEAGPLVAADVPGLLAPVKGHHMAKAALELAVLDAELTAADVALAEAFGAVRDRVPAGVSVGIPDGGIPSLLEEVAGHVEAGYLRVKLKIEPGFDVEPVTAVRQAHPDVPLQVDANAGYDRRDADRLVALDDLDLVLIEQPFPPDRLLDHVRLAERLRTPICLDESITSADAARDAIDLGACSVVNIKLGRVGGFLEAVAVRDACRAADVPAWCGGMLETGIGRAANVALASLPGFELPGDTSASERYWRQDVTAPFVLHDGHLAVPDGPGLGVRPLPEILAAVTVARDCVLGAH